MAGGTDVRRSGGRPSSFTQDTADEICERLASGKGLAEICRDPVMPSEATVYRWLDQHEVFTAQYAKARLLQADHFGDEILEIADEGSLEDTQRARLRVDARKWLMSKLAPKKYGDRVAQELSGPDGGPIPIAAVSDMDRAKALAAFLAKTKGLAPPQP